MSALPVARSLAPSEGAGDGIALSYEGRLLRRKRLVSESGRAFLVDLPEVVSVDESQAFALDDGSRIAVRAAPEALLRIEGPDLPRLAWHIGNRHTPCQIAEGHLLIREDHVLEGMLSGLGARIARIVAPFTPEGGAYGHGRTFGHSHGHGHDHGHAHAHDGDGGHHHADAGEHRHGPAHAHGHHHAHPGAHGEGEPEGDKGAARDEHR